MTVKKTEINQTKPTEQTLTVATYNIRHGRDVDFAWNRLADHIRAVGADLVGIQEVDMFTARSRGLDSLAGLSAAAGLPHALFTPVMDYDGGQYGTAILSRYPLTAAEVHPLPFGNYEPRAFGYVRVLLPSNDDPNGTSVCFLNTHLSYESAEQQYTQLAALADWIGKHPAKAPTVLTGDFNTENFAAFAPLNALGFALVNDSDHRYATFRTEPIAIDNIVYSADRLTPVASGMIDSPDSDHNLLWCRFELI